MYVTEPEEEQGEQEDRKGWQVGRRLQEKRMKEGIKGSIHPGGNIRAPNPSHWATSNGLSDAAIPLKVMDHREGASSGTHILSPQQPSEVL